MRPAPRLWRQPHAATEATRHKANTVASIAPMAPAKAAILMQLIDERHKDIYHIIHTMANSTLKYSWCTAYGSDVICCLLFKCDLCAYSRLCSTCERPIGRTILLYYVIICLRNNVYTRRKKVILPYNWVLEKRYKIKLRSEL